MIKFTQKLLVVLFFSVALPADLWGENSEELIMLGTRAKNSCQQDAWCSEGEISLGDKFSDYNFDTVDVQGPPPEGGHIIVTADRLEDEGDNEKDKDCQESRDNANAMVDSIVNGEALAAAVLNLAEIHAFNFDITTAEERRLLGVSDAEAKKSTEQFNKNFDRYKAAFNVAKAKADKEGKDVCVLTEFDPTDEYSSQGAFAIYAKSQGAKVARMDIKALTDNASTTNLPDMTSFERAQHIKHMNDRDSIMATNIKAAVQSGCGAVVSTSGGAHLSDYAETGADEAYDKERNNIAENLSSSGLNAININFALLDSGTCNSGTVEIQ